MPNWCENYIKVTGNTKQLVRFDEYIKNASITVEDSNKILLSFAILNGEKESEEYVQSQYGHRLASENTNQEELLLYFDTPWGPPLEIAEALRSKFPNLKISWEYEEPNEDLKGNL